MLALRALDSLRKKWPLERGSGAPLREIVEEAENLAGNLIIGGEAYPDDLDGRIERGMRQLDEMGLICSSSAPWWSDTTVFVIRFEKEDTVAALLESIAPVRLFFGTRGRVSLLAS